MEINVSQLLKAPIGSTREFSLDNSVPILGEELKSLVTGRVKLTKTHRGVLVQGTVETTMPLECSRCLKTFNNKLLVNVEEEYFPSLDINSGTPLELPDEPGSFTIDEHHILDLSEAIRQNALLALPMKPLCREDCAGLCPVCGKDRNKHKCNCNHDSIDPRWAKLGSLVVVSKKVEKEKRKRSKNGTSN
jgi:uncharacterized protein